MIGFVNYAQILNHKDKKCNVLCARVDLDL